MNINDQIECRLTAYGREVLARYYINLYGTNPYGPSSDPDYTLWERNANVESALKTREVRPETYRFALWEFARIFGPKFSMGGRQIVEGNEIDVVG